MQTMHRMKFNVIKEFKNYVPEHCKALKEDSAKVYIAGELAEEGHTYSAHREWEIDGVAKVHADADEIDCYVEYAEYFLVDSVKDKWRRYEGEHQVEDVGVEDGCCVKHKPAPEDVPEVCAAHWLQKVQIIDEKYRATERVYDICQ